MNNANTYAQQQANIFKESLQYLIDQQNEQKKLAEQLINKNYENAINKINQGRIPIEQQYKADAQQAYTNKMLAGQQLQSDLNTLGLNTTGFGVSQNMMNENAYSANLNQLALDRNASIRELDAKLGDLEAQKGTDLLNLEIDYADRLATLNQYINEQVENKYQTEYNKFYTDMQYKNQLAYRGSGGSSGSSGSSGSKGSSGFSSSSGFKNTAEDTVDYADAFGNSQDTVNKSNYYFKDSMQPRYVNNEELKYSYIYGKDIEAFLKKTQGISLKDIGSSGNANIWKTSSGKYYIWDNVGDGQGNKFYRDITDFMRAFLNSSYNKSSSSNSSSKPLVSKPTSSKPLVSKPILASKPTLVSKPSANKPKITNIKPFTKNNRLYTGR